MNHYTIYTKEKIDDRILHPNHIYATNATEAIEVLAASDNCKREFVSDIDPQQKQCYTYVNLKPFGKESGYLLTDAMKFKVNDDTVLRSCPE